MWRFVATISEYGSLGPVAMFLLSLTPSLCSLQCFLHGQCELAFHLGLTMPWGSRICYLSTSSIQNYLEHNPVWLCSGLLQLFGPYRNLIPEGFHLSNTLI